jgi:hypothetical protein
MFSYTYSIFYFSGGFESSKWCCGVFLCCVIDLFVFVSETVG